MTKEEKEKRLNEQAFYNLRSILGNNWASIFALIGGRQRGKSYAIMKKFLSDFFNKKSNPFIWMRLTENATKKLLKNNAYDLIDPDLKRKYNLNLKVKGNNVFNCTKIKDKNGKTIQKETLLCRVLPLSTFYNDKGVGYFDKDAKGIFNICLDEMNRESNERNTFDIAYAFAQQLENNVRNLKNDKEHTLRVFIVGNTLQDASDLMVAFNFLPEKFGRFKIKKRKLVVDYIPNSDAYLKMREGSIATMILGSDNSTFSNKVDFDLNLITKKHLIKPYSIIKFSNNTKNWFTLWNDNIINPYNGEKCKSTFAMIEYINDEVYDKDRAKMVIDFYNKRYLKFHTLVCQRLFKKSLELLQKDKNVL